MAELSTLARPYAQAVFNIALEGNKLDHWSQTLMLLNQVIKDEALQEMVNNPYSDKKALAGIIHSVCDQQIDEQAHNLVDVLIENNRLGAMSQISDRFEFLRAEAESVIEADVESALPVEDEQLAKLAASLEKHFGKKVKLSSTVNKDLMGGILIRAGDTVIDGSVRAKLEKLASTICA